MVPMQSFTTSGHRSAPQARLLERARRRELLAPGVGSGGPALLPRLDRAHRHRRSEPRRGLLRGADGAPFARARGAHPRLAVLPAAAARRREPQPPGRARGVPAARGLHAVRQHPPVRHPLPRREPHAGARHPRGAAAPPDRLSRIPGRGAGARRQRRRRYCCRASCAASGWPATRISTRTPRRASRSRSSTWWVRPMRRCRARIASALRSPPRSASAS